MKALEIAMNSRPKNKSFLGIQSLLKPATEGEVTCQFCGKARKKWGSTFVLK
jgi:hypothetical protein